MFEKDIERKSGWRWGWGGEEETGARDDKGMEFPPLFSKGIIKSIILTFRC